jgi:predicted dehydrogenase
MAAAASRPLPRLGFLGLGWIGRHRLECLLADAGRPAQVAALSDPDDRMLDEASRLAPAAVCVRSIDDMLDPALRLDGIVIATPSAGHAAESAAAIGAGLAVFCQKPLGRTAPETRRVVDLARAHDVLLGVDLSYRHLAAVDAVDRLVRQGELGELVAVELTFHNAYGPDKPWYYDRTRSGGGCVVDLGVHLIDLLHRLTGLRSWHVGAAALFAQGRPWTPESGAVEDLAFVQLDHPSGVAARLACSWRLPAGCDAVIECTVHGTRAAARVRNVGGSFYDFTAERLDRGRLDTLVRPPDAWGGRALRAWAGRLRDGTGFDSTAEVLVDVAAVMDAIYEAATPGSAPEPASPSRTAAS